MHKLAEFQPKRVVFILNPNDKGQSNYPNRSTSGYKMKFWGLLAMIAYIAYTTQQNHKDITTNHNVPSQEGRLSLLLVGQGQAHN